VRKVLLLLIIFLAAMVLIASCGGGGKGPVIQPPPNNNNNPPDDNNPPADDTAKTVSISGVLTYSGLLQTTEGSERMSSTTPIANAGVALNNNQAALGATVTSDTGWFELDVEDCPTDADLRLKMELKTSDTAQNRLYVDLPFELDGTALGNVNLSLSGYDDSGDGVPDGLRLQGGINGGSFKDGVFGSNGLDMPFGESGPHHGWLNENDNFFEGTSGFGDGWNEDFDLNNASSPPLPDGSKPPSGGDNTENRIEVNGKVVDVDAENRVYSAEGVRIIFISGLVFEEHGTFAVHVLDDTKLEGLETFDDIVLGLELKAAGKRLVDDVLQANRVRTVVDRPDSEGYFAADGTIIEVNLDPREIWPPTEANVKIDGVLITFDPTDGMPDFEFGEFVISADSSTILAGIDNLGELQPKMRVTFFGPFNTNQLLASLLITSPLPPTPPPPPPPFGVTFNGQVVDLKPDQQLVGVLGYWSDIIDGEGFGNRPPWSNPNDSSGGNKTPMQTDNWGRPDDLGNEGEGYGGTCPPGYPDDPTTGMPEPILLWIKIVPDTKLAGIEKFDDIVIGDYIWSEMLILDDGSLAKDENGNPIAAYFEDQRPIPPAPGVYGIVTDIQIFEDFAGNMGNNGVITISPYQPLPMKYPNDPTIPPDGTITDVQVRVTPDTILEGIVNLNEVVIGEEGHALFEVDENGEVVLDEEGHPIAKVFGVYIAPPPPPPPSSVYGQVLEVNVFEDLPQNNGTVKIETYAYGQGGPDGGWIDPADPNGGGTDPGTGMPPSGDPNNPPIRAEFVVVRIDEATQLEGVGSLIEMAGITDPMDAEAIFRLNSDGTPMLDEAGNPVADILYVYPVTPPPPPDEFITMEGSVMEYVEGDYIIISPAYNDGQAGIPEFRFEIDELTKIESESGIQQGDQVFIEGKQVLDPSGTAAYIADYIQEYEYIPM
jgi:hypothetical protein